MAVLYWKPYYSEVRYNEIELYSENAGADSIKTLYFFLLLKRRINHSEVVTRWMYSLVNCDLTHLLQCAQGVMRKPIFKVADNASHLAYRQVKKIQIYTVYNTELDSVYPPQTTNYLRLI